MSTLDFLSEKYHFDLTAESPIKLLGVSRDSMLQWLNELNFQVGVEIGVDEGDYSELICQTNQHMQVYGVDPYEPYPGSTDVIQDYEFANKYAEARRRLNPYPNYTLLREYSTQALNKFADDSLDFVYIDANHSDPYVSEDIAGWSKKVKKGGIVSGDDYLEEISVRFSKGSGVLFGQPFEYKVQNELSHRWNVIEAVNHYIRANAIKPWFLLELDPTWLWIKP